MDHELLAQMRGSNHSLTNKDMGIEDCPDKVVETSTWHAEGTVESHTLMVYNQLPEDAPDMLKFLALYHDISKPFCRGYNPKNNRINFLGHDIAGAYNCISRARKYFHEGCIMNIVKCIAWHQCIFKNDEVAMDTLFDTYPTYLQELARADDDGRITDVVRNTHPEVKTIPQVDTTDPSKPNLFVTVGIPGCGKSTIAKQYANKIISPDEILMEYANERGITNYSEAFKTLSQDKSIDWTRDAKKRLRDHLHDHKEDIVYDATNLTRKGRKALKTYAEAENYNLVILLVFRDFQECIECRNGEKNIPMGVYKQMFKSFSYPTKPEYDNLIVKLVK